MTKAEVVNQVSKHTGVDKITVLAVIEAFTQEVKSSLAEGNNIYLRGFGSFILKQRAEKTARNISKNTTVIVPAHVIPAFKPSRSFKDQCTKQA